MAANLGLVVIPSGTVLEKRENPPQIQDGSFTTYRLQPDLSIIGDLYGSQERGIERFTGRPFANGSESYSSHLTTTDADADSANEDDAWSPYRGTKVLDLSDIANEFVPSKPIPYPVEGRRTRYKLRNEVVDQILKTEFKYETLYKPHSIAELTLGIGGIVTKCGRLTSTNCLPSLNKSDTLSKNIATEYIIFTWEMSSMTWTLKKTLEASRISTKPSSRQSRKNSIPQIQFLNCVRAEKSRPSSALRMSRSQSPLRPTNKHPSPRFDNFTD